MGIENDEEGEPQRIAENVLSAENCGHLIVHVLDETELNDSKK